MPYASANLIPLPDSVTDEQAIALSDIYPTAWFGAQLAEVSRGDTVAVFGAGPATGNRRSVAVRCRPGDRRGRILTHTKPVDDVLDAYRTFDRREPGW